MSNAIGATFGSTGIFVLTNTSGSAIPLLSGTIPNGHSHAVDYLDSLTQSYIASGALTCTPSNVTDVVTTSALSYTGTGTISGAGQIVTVSSYATADNNFATITQEVVKLRNDLASLMNQVSEKTTTVTGV